jgi:hypothetical protein
MGPTESTKILLVEGVPGAGKSTLIGSLLRRYVAETVRVRGLLHLTQAHTYFPLSPDEPEGVCATREQNAAHLGRVLEVLTWLASSNADGRARMFLCAIDTLHLTHCFRPGVLGWDDVRDFDRRLSRLGCGLLFLRATKETIWERAILGRKDNEFITRYGRKYGDGLEAIHRHFVDEQEKMLDLAGRSEMETLILDCEDPAEDLPQRAFDLWMR